MVIIKVNANLHPVALAKLRRALTERAAAGEPLLVPEFCEVLVEVPDGEEIRVEQKNEDERLAAALKHQDLRHLPDTVTDVLRRLDAAVFTTISPALAKDAANVIRLQREQLEGKEWHL